MLDRDTILKRLREHEAELRRRGVSALYLFGSVARGEAGPASDVDLFFDYDDPTFNLFDVMDVEEEVVALLGIKADVMTRGSLHPRLRQRIEGGAVRVF
jgi:predicted nucleotidyltransferase